jgi:hypothetical protein
MFGFSAGDITPGVFRQPDGLRDHSSVDGVGITSRLDVCRSIRAGLAERDRRRWRSSSAGSGAALV